MSQRNVLLVLGEPTFYAKSHRAKVFFQGRSFVPAESITRAHFPYEKEIGTPSLRTTWNIQSSTATFRLAVIRETLAEGEVLPSFFVTIALEANVGDTVIAVTLIRIKIPSFKGTKKEVQEWFEEIVELKQYALEFLSPAIVYGGEQLSFKIKLEGGYTSTEANKFFTLVFEEASVNTVYEQVFGKFR